ncbi:hypothetical protein Q3C01_17515 [Bradyrhizobium sp. UFLA05-109]
MAISMKGNRINVRPDDPAFSVATNLCDWFELGERAGQGHWLEGAVSYLMVGFFYQAKAITGR